MQTQIRGFSQIKDGTIPASKFVSGLGLLTAQLAEGALFIKKDGLVAFAADQSMGGFKLTNLADATSVTDAVNLRTAQALINGIAIKPTAKVVSVTNVAIATVTSIDGVTLATGDRVLLVAQTAGAENGLYVFTSGSGLSRPSDYAALSTQKEGILVLVAEGSIYKDTKWISITDGSPIVNTTPTSWVQDLSGIVYSAGTGLDLIGSTFSVKYGKGIDVDTNGNIFLDVDGTNLQVNADGLKIANGTPGQLMLADPSGVAKFTTVSGQVTISSTGVTSINSNASTGGFLKYDSFVSNETVTGLIDASNVTFTTAFTPVINSLQLYYNGNLLEAGTGNDYNISNSTITMLFAPIAGDKLKAYYVK